MWLQVSEHCLDYGLLPDYKSAYQPDYSCETCLLKLSNNILWNFERQRITALTAMDLLAAFNTVDHKVLLTILTNKFGIVDTAQSWFHTYLQPRHFKVYVENTYSSEIGLKYSVPQGSCTSANVFNLYCAPLGDVVSPDLSLSGFVDDHSIRSDFKGDKEAELYCKNKLESTMITVKSWMDTMWLKMNAAKTKFIYFGHRLQLSKCTESSLNVVGDHIQCTECIRYLRAMLDSELSFKSHVIMKCKVAMCNLLKIRSIRHLLDDQTTANLCLNLCISHLDYANSLLYSLPKSTLNRMQRVQNTCARLSLRKGPRDSITACLMELHWLPIKYHIQFKILTLTHKCLQGLGPMYLRNLITPLVPRREGLRSESDTHLLLIPRAKCKTFAA